MFQSRKWLFHYIFPSSADNNDSVRFLFRKLTRFEIVLVNEISLDWGPVSSESFVPPLEVLFWRRGFDDVTGDLVFNLKPNTFNQQL